MFNETSYPSGLGDQAAVERRLARGKRVKASKLAKFGLSQGDFAPAPLPLPRKGPIQGPDPGTHTIDMTPGAGTGTSTGSSEDSGSGFDLGGIFSAIPWWGWLIGAYFLLKRR